jgi:insulysin
MRFPGSEKYPEMGYFDELLSRAGGFSNAYTDNTDTNYFFSVASDQLDKALDVFGHFFLDPAFNEAAVNKEVNAVNSEYEIDVASDEWKFVNILSLLATEGHPQSRFNIGNTDTLQKKGVINALREFHKQYSSNLMSLAIRSSWSLDILESWLVKSSPFGKIQNTKAKA